MLYNLLNNLITAGKFTKDDMTNKLNVFFTFNQVTQEQYQELLTKVDPTATGTPAQ
jgi:hypothetical protein